MKIRVLQPVKRLAGRGFGWLYARLPKKYLYPVLGLLGLYLLYWVVSFGIHVAWVVTSDEVTFTMEDRERVERNGQSNYEVYTSEGIFANEGSWFHFKRRSGDLQNDLRPGHTYSCQTQGFRLPTYDLMENLIECEEVTPPAS